MIQPTNAQFPIPNGGANAVNINIYNPQAYGSTTNAQQAQTAPYGYTNSLYNVPQASVYNQGVQYSPEQYVQQPSQEFVQNPIAQPAVAAIPAPQLMPNSVLEQAPIQAANAVEINNQPEEQQTTQVDTDALINDLKSTDTKVREAAINKLAEYAQDEDINVVKQVIAEPIMQALVDIISEDTTGLQGPTDEQIAVAEKVAKGEQLTPEEDKISEELSPRDAANQNRMFALYTLAMLQKLQRDEVDEYIASQKENGQEAIEPLKLQDVYGYQGVENVIKNDTRPEVKVAAIQSLRYVARPEDLQDVKEVLKDALKSSDEEVKAVAQETVETLSK